MMRTTSRPATRQTPPPAAPAAEPGRRPTHYAYAVRQGGNNKSYWTRIGAAWANRDGEGFSLKLDLLPIDGSDIVIRTPQDERQDGGEQ